MQLINVKNQLDLSYLNITQLLELKTPVGFEVNVPDIGVDTNAIIAGNIDDIYSTALGSRPDVKSSELMLKSSETDLKIAQGARSPRISMSHSFNTGYADSRQKISIDPVTGNPITGKYPFGEQINDNINWGLGVTMSIPILNGWQVNKNISNSKLSIRNSQYRRDKETALQEYSAGLC